MRRCRHTSPRTTLGRGFTFPIRRVRTAPGADALSWVPFVYRETWIHHHTHADCTSRSRGPLRRRLPYPRQHQQRHVTYGDRGRWQHSLSRQILDDVAKDLAIPWRAWQSTAKSVAGAGLKRRRGLAAAVTSRFPTACGAALLGGRRRRAEIRPAGYGRCRDPVGQAPGRRVGWLAGEAEHNRHTGIRKRRKKRRSRP